MAKHGFRQKAHSDKQYMTGTPNRIEVANYTNALIEKHVIPEMKKLIMAVNAQASLSHQVVLALLLKKGICTEEEIKEITEEFIKKAVKGGEAKQPDQPDQTESKDSEPKGTEPEQPVENKEPKKKTTRKES